MIKGHCSMRKIIFFLVIIISFMNVTNGSSIDPEGIPWKDIHFWRFWQSEKGVLVEKILILNENKDSINISFMVAHSIDGPRESIKVVTDSSFGIVGGPWQIPAKVYKIIYMPQLPDSNGMRGYYYKILCSSSDKTGLIYIFNPKPKGKFSDDKIITTLGGDVVGHSPGDYWWEQSSLFALSGEEISFHFTFIPQIINPRSTTNEWYISVKDQTDSVKSGSHLLLQLIRVENGKFPIESKIVAPDKPYKWKSLTVNFPSITDSSEYKDNFSVDFIIKAPKVETPKFYIFPSFVMRGGNGGTFFLPLIVLPK